MSNNKREGSGKKRQRHGRSECELQFGNKYGGGAKKKPEANR